MQSFRLGSLFGFEVRIDLSWLLIFFLIIWTLTVNLFPLNYPGLSGSTYIVMGITGTILFFASLVLHELSHSLVARTKGIPVEGITLFAFGGVSRTRMDAETPGDEFQIAGIGPLTSLGLAGLFGLISYVAQAANWSVVITGIAAYLAWINIILAVFNLLPGFPLDGGRLFRATLWKFTNNLKKATRIASIGGRLLGFALITLGFLQLFSPTADFIGGLWLILIGWFLNNAAESSYQDLLIRSTLEGLRVREVATFNPETVPASLTLQQLMDEYFFNRSYQSFPVMENNHPIGLVTLNQVKQIPRDAWNRRTVKDIMLPTGIGITVNLGDNMMQVIEKMKEARSQRLLVTNNGNLQGIISATDLANWLQRKRDFGDDIPQPKTFSEQVSNNFRQETKV